jgi:hypothetical protein
LLHFILTPIKDNIEAILPINPTTPPTVAKATAYLLFVSIPLRPIISNKYDNN